MTTAKKVTDFFIIKNQKEFKEKIDRVKLQKLIYYGQAWNLVFWDKPLFEDKIKAWKKGPVIPSTRIYFIEINKTYNSIKIENQDEYNELDKEEIYTLDEVWSVYKHFSANYLVELTHSESPWYKIYEPDFNGRCEKEITIETIKNYFIYLKEIDFNGKQRISNESVEKKKENKIEVEMIDGKIKIVERFKYFNFLSQNWLKIKR